jgi:hypothetical protein
MEAYIGKWLGGKCKLDFGNSVDSVSVAGVEVHPGSLVEQDKTNQILK